VVPGVPPVVEPIVPPVVPPIVPPGFVPLIEPAVPSVVPPIVSAPVVPDIVPPVVLDVVLRVLPRAFVPCCVRVVAVDPDVLVVGLVWSIEPVDAPPFMVPVADPLIPLLVVPPVVLPVVCAIATPGIIRAAAAIDVKIRIFLSPIFLKKKAIAVKYVPYDLNIKGLLSDSIPGAEYLSSTYAT
jgi:hypothetical protein